MKVLATELVTVGAVPTPIFANAPGGTKQIWLFVWGTDEDAAEIRIAMRGADGVRYRPGFIIRGRRMRSTNNPWVFERINQTIAKQACAVADGEATVCVFYRGISTGEDGRPAKAPTSESP